MPKALLIHATDPNLHCAEQPPTPFPVLGITTLAALFPDHWQLELIDENFEKADTSRDADLVIISTLTLNAPHAYEMAAVFKKRNIPILMGGMHPSACPEEAIKHCNALVIGEAEGVFHKVLADFEAGTMAGVYKGETIDLSTVPSPRLDYLPASHFKTLGPVQATRGCPYDCDFCSVTTFFGHKYRFRPVETVIADVKAVLQRTKSNIIFFVDDNIAGNPTYAKKLFTALIPLKIRWGSFASITMSNDLELMALAEKSGCVQLFIGFESIQQENLDNSHKKWVQVDKMKDHIKIFHDHGVIIEGSFVFGHDQERKDIFARTAHFIQEHGIQVPVFGVLTPYPATRLRKRLEDAGRLLPAASDWRLYDATHVLFQPMHMSPEELEEGLLWIKKYCGSPSTIFKRVLKGPRKNSLMALGINFSMFTGRMRQINERWPKKIKGPLVRPGSW
ncbi:MAG: B12-binding domain-containing radical SAM protein [Proteobacteria bacterium]|nr:B12-binding domain-containing radical SAM protein [Pseudomonadota bacterium]MBU1640522.1 B12-binding domain-containing radical SAM protein [Pseudomonadota bacterium]